MSNYNGLGFSTSCDQQNEDFLDGANEINKLAIGTATTINALIPILISIQRLPTASIHELVLRDHDTLAIITAALTFGLPVVQEPNREVIDAADYSRDNSSHIQGDSDSGSSRRRRIFSSIYVLLQLLCVIVPTWLSHHIAKSRGLNLWTCGRNSNIVWFGMFFLPSPIVGITWYCFLRWNYHTDRSVGRERRLIVYCKRRWVQSADPFMNQLPGFAQMLISVYYTFILSTTYGESVEVALVRVIMVATALFISRTMSVWFARWSRKSEPRDLVRCESKDEMNWVLGYREIRHPQGPQISHPSPV